MNQAVAFYCDRLGFELIHRKTVLDGVGSALEAAFVQCGNLVLELFQPVGSGKEIAKRGPGIIDHYAIDAPDFQECVRMAADKGLVLHESTPDGEVWYETVGNKGVRGINYCGPNKEVIEFCHNYEWNYTGKVGLNGWSHLALKVRDLKRSVSFYEKLGFVKCADGYLDTPQGRLQIAFVDLHGFQLEIIQVTESMLPELEKRGPGNIDHFALDVSDIQDAFGACKQEGLRISDCVVKELSLFDSGIKYFLVEGLDGEMIELNQKRSY